jgi:hypothetical protein
MRPLKGRRI